jgi:hypothetical protein
LGHLMGVVTGVNAHRLLERSTGGAKFAAR